MKAIDDFSADLIGVPDKRLSYLPGGLRDDFTLVTRELTQHDGDQARRALRRAGVKMSATRMWTWLSEYPYRAVGVFRSARSLVALCFSTHYPDRAENSVLALWAADEYYQTKVPLRLLQLARLELPEYPSRIRVLATDAKLREYLRWAGWADTTDDGNQEGDPDYREYRVRQVAGRSEHSETFAKSRLARTEAADD